VSGPAFFQTRLGQVFFDVTMPKIADHLGRLGITLQTICDLLQASHTRPAETHVPSRPAAAVDTAPTASAPTSVSIASDEPDVMETFAQIAREYLGIATLEERKRDSLDFHEVSILSVTAALRATYDAGFAAGVRHIPH
jgi:hypothetical protein